MSSLARFKGVVTSTDARMKRRHFMGTQSTGTCLEKVRCHSVFFLHCNRNCLPVLKMLSGMFEFPRYPRAFLLALMSESWSINRSNIALSKIRVASSPLGVIAWILWRVSRNQRSSFLRVTSCVIDPDSNNAAVTTSTCSSILWSVATTKSYRAHLFSDMVGAFGSSWDDWFTGTDPVEAESATTTPCAGLHDFLSQIASPCCKMVNWLFTLGFPVQTNTDRSFLVVFEVVYVVRWYKYK